MAVLAQICLLTTAAGQIIFGPAALLFQQQAKIIISTNPKVPSPLLAGTFTVSAYNRRIVPLSGSGRTLTPAHIEAVLPRNPPVRAFFDVNSNGFVDAFDNTTTPGSFPRFLNNQGLRSGRHYFGSGQNIVVIAQFSTWTSVRRPQFIALHMQTNATRGQPITLASILSADIVAGDLLNSPPAPGGGTMQGMLLRSPGSVQLTVESGRVPAQYSYGSIGGRVEGDVSFTDSAGKVFSAHVNFAFWSLIVDDRSSQMPNGSFNPTDTVTALPGP